LTLTRADVPMALLMRFPRVLLACLFAGAAPSFALQLGPPSAYTIPPTLRIPPGTVIPSDAQLVASGARIGMISTGPDRDHTILLDDFVSELKVAAQKP